MSRHRQRSIPWRGVAIVVAGALLAGGVALGVMTYVHPSASPDAPAVMGTDLRGNTVTLDPGEELGPTTVKQMQAVPDAGGRFQVPSVGLDVPLGELTMSGGTITPPGFSSAYRVRNLGVAPTDAAAGTVFVAMHSLRGGAVGPGNYLIDVAAQKAKVAVGAEIDVAGVAYAVTGSEVIPKTKISSDQGVWANTPNRLVVVTCLQRPQGGASVDNIVITAMRTPAP